MATGKKAYPDVLDRFCVSSLSRTEKNVILDSSGFGQSLSTMFNQTTA